MSDADIGWAEIVVVGPLRETVLLSIAAAIAMRVVPTNPSAGAVRWVPALLVGIPFALAHAPATIGRIVTMLPACIAIGAVLCRTNASFPRRLVEAFLLHTAINALLLTGWHGWST